MSGRNRGPSSSMNGRSYGGLQAPVHQPPFFRDLGGPLPYRHSDSRETQFRVDPRDLPLHNSIMEERLAAQNQDVHGLLADNQRLAATHVALKQELEAAQHEFQRRMHYIDSFRTEEDIMMREMYDKSLRSEIKLREVESMQAEVQKIRADIKKLTSGKQELTNQVHMMTQDLARVTADLRQIPTLTAEIENTKQELQRARAANEFEKKGYAENYNNGKIMENNLVAMARELEKLRAEIANSVTSVPVGNPGGVGYGGGYGNHEAGYYVNPYQPNYVMNPTQVGVEGYYPPQPYGPPAAWTGGYDLQPPQGQ